MTTVVGRLGGGIDDAPEIDADNAAKVDDAAAESAAEFDDAAENNGTRDSKVSTHAKHILPTSLSQC